MSDTTDPTPVTTPDPGTSATTATPAAPPVVPTDTGTVQPTADAGNTPQTTPVDAANTPAEPAVYELKAPEGATIDQATMTAFVDLAKEVGIAPEAAQKLVDFQAKQQAAMVESTTKAWLEAAKADPEIGGAAFEASTAKAQEAFGKFATPELKTFLESTGLGNHPEMLRMFARIGKASAEPAPFQAAPVSLTPSLYPKSNMSK